jgi:hypothetical protein
VPDEKIERLRSLLAHANEEEKVDPSPVQDSSRMSYAASADEIDRLRSKSRMPMTERRRILSGDLFHGSPDDSLLGRSGSNSLERIKMPPDAAPVDARLPTRR